MGGVISDVPFSLVVQAEGGGGSLWVWVRSSDVVAILIYGGIAGVEVVA